MSSAMNMAAARASFWYAVGHAIHDYPAGVEPFDPTVAYAGPAANRWLSALIPEYVYGCNCNKAFYAHDYRYACAVPAEHRDDLRKFADDCMRHDMIAICIESGLHGFTLWLARRRSLKYWLAVRWGGGKHYGLPSKVADKKGAENE